MKPYPLPDQLAHLKLWFGHVENEVTWNQIAIRLLWTVIAGVVIGINREEHGRSAGFRTTLLVCLAASVSMIQVNLLLPIAGKAPNSYAVMDLMRLPLGILSGMGFIGAGAILRREGKVHGVTTAATLWFVTVIGLCFGGGQIKLGAVALALGFITLTGLKWLERCWKTEHSAVLALVPGSSPVTEAEIAQAIADVGFKIHFISLAYGPGGSLSEIRCRLRWLARPGDNHPPAFLKQFVSRFASVKLELVTDAS